MRPCTPGMAAVRAILTLLFVLAPSLAQAQTTIYQYDSNYNVLDTIDAAGAVTSMTYDTGSQQGLVVDSEAAGSTTRYYYDTNYNETQSYSEPSSVTSSAYDSAGNDVVTGDANGTVYQYKYDDSPYDPPISPSGPVTSTVYDYSDNLIVVGTEDSMGKTTQTYYDADGTVVGSFDPQGMVTATAYDGAGRDLIVAADIGGQDTLTVYHYDGSTYDAVDQIDTSAPVTNMVYDSQDNRLIADFPAQSFFDVFTEINIGGINEFQSSTPLVVDTPGNPTQLAYDSANNQLFVAMTPETPGVWLLAPALLALAGAVLIRRRGRLAIK